MSLHKGLFSAPVQKRCFHHKNKRSLFLSTTLTSPIQSPVLTKKRLYSKPAPPRIAASIVKTSKACFYLPKPVSTQNSGLFYLPKPVSTHNSGLFYPRSLFYLHKARFYLKPAPFQNRRFHRKNKRSLFYLHKSSFLPTTLACFTHEACFIYTKPVFI